MAQARRRKSRTAKRRLTIPGWALLLVGLGVGAVAVVAGQSIVKRSGDRDGLAGLFRKTAEPPREATKPAPPKPAPKPELEFYTILLKDETVLPERRSGNRSRSAKTEEGVRYILQAASFAAYADADQLKAKLALSGLLANVQKVTIEGKGDFYRVRLGPYDNLTELDKANQRLKQLGIQALQLRVKQGA